jgi:cytochrome c oxidase cbb3-type subunit I
MSVTHSVAMALPVYTVLINLWLTARGRGAALLADPGCRFMLFSSIWYLLVCTQGPVQSLPSLQRVTHFNNWTIGHAHIAVLGFAGFAALGALWHTLPLAARRELHSPRLVHLQGALLLFGLGGFFVVLTAAGLIQGSAWNHGAAEYRVLPQIAPYMALRAALGVSIVGAAALGLYNVCLTLARGRPLPAAGEIEPEEYAP